jgi:ribosomal protein S18 acetylase RimI-like enzyme
VPSDYTVRPARPADADAVYEVMRQSRRDAFSGLLPPAALDWDAAVPDAFDAFVRETVSHSEKAMLVATRDGAVVGVAELVWRPEATAEFVAASAAELKAIHVRPADRNEGVGSTLLDEAFATPPSDVAGLSLCVLRGNQQARAFYERRGFEQTGTTTTTHAGDDFTEAVYHRPL